MAEGKLTVWMGGQRVGTVVDYGGRDVRFRYDADYASDPRATPISTSMPLGRVEHSARAWLRGLLPSSPSIVRAWAAWAGTRPTDVVGILELVGGDAAGAVTFGTGDAPPGAPALHPVTEVELAAALADLRVGRIAWHTPGYRPGWTLSGGQPKLALAHTPKRGWCIPEGGAATTHILKPPIAADHDLNEAICMRAAELLGIPAARTEIGRFDSERAVISTRFDRTVGPDGAVRRIHQEDLCQALGVDPALRYESDGGPSVADLFALLRDHSTDPAADVARLVDAIAYSWLILGTDAHAGNFSIALRGGEVALAPLYDVASYAPYTTRPGQARMAQRIGGAELAGRIGVRHWGRLAEEARLDPVVVVDRARTLAGRVPDAVRDAVAGLDLTAPEWSAAARIFDAAARWAERCRTRLR